MLSKKQLEIAKLSGNPKKLEASDFSKLRSMGNKKKKGVGYGSNSHAIAKYTAITGKSDKVKGVMGTKPIPKVKFGHNSKRMRY